MFVSRALSVLLLLLCASRASEEGKRNATVVRVIAVLPLTHPLYPAQWERGLEILPGAQLAVDQVNAMGVLPGYLVELVTVDEAACDPAASAVSVYGEMADLEGGGSAANVIGVVGMTCPAAVTAVLSVCGAPPYNSVQLLAGPGAPLRRPLSVRTLIADSTAYASMGGPLLDELGATSGFAVLYSGKSDAYTYYLPAAEALVRSAQAQEGRGVGSGSEGNSNTVRLSRYMRQVETNDAEEAVSDLLRMRESGLVSAVYVSADVAVAARILCAAGSDASRGRLTWPDMVWLVLDHETSELHAARQCSTQALAAGLEGAILVSRNLEPPDVDRKLVAGHTYREYLDLLKRYSPCQYCANPYAGVLYDAVWTLALALNRSLQDRSGPEVGAGAFLHPLPLPLGRWVEEGLPSVSFNGAMGFVDFGSGNLTSGGGRGIRVQQIVSGKPTLMGYYAASRNNLDVVNPLGKQNGLPGLLSTGTTPNYALMPAAVGGVVLILLGLVVVLVTGDLALLLHYRGESEIKAASPKISSFAFLGCYFLCSSAALEVTFRSFPVVGGAARAVACSAVVWPASVGLNLILSSLLVRLARVYYLFTRIRVLHVRREGELWTDRTLLCIILLVALGNVGLLGVWAGVDLYQVVDDEVYTSSSYGAQAVVYQYCQSRYLGVWLALVYLYSAVLAGVILVFTTLTRKIKRRNFKDTKKLNAFVFALLATFSAILPLWWVCRYLNSTLSGVVLCLCYGFAALLCQLLLYVPKTVPPFLRDVFRARLREEQATPSSTVDSERRRPSLLRKMSSTAL